MGIVSIKVGGASLTLALVAAVLHETRPMGWQQTPNLLPVHVHSRQNHKAIALLVSEGYLVQDQDRPELSVH